MADIQATKELKGGGLVFDYHQYDNADAYLDEMKTLISVEKEQNSTIIEKMLSLVNKYGLSHVCANREFQNIEYWGDGKDKHGRGLLFNFPYIDMHFSKEHIEGSASTRWAEESKFQFYFRGTKQRSLKFQNLFEYFLSIRNHGTGLKI